MLLALAPAGGSIQASAVFVGELSQGCPVVSEHSGAALMTQGNEAPAAVIYSGATFSVPPRHSHPTAKAKLFLDFDGHYEAKWGDWRNVRTPAFDQDFNPTSFSSAELAAIDEIWARVAEDYAPFNIDVTTVDPGTYAQGEVAVIAIGGQESDWFGESGAGVAYVAGFTSTFVASNVGYVFSRELGNVAKYVADAASHEAGHLFGLLHQARWDGNRLVEEYHAGNAAWAPLMGVSYDAQRSTWHNGTPDSSHSVGHDDMAILGGSENGFGYRADDFGDTVETAAALPSSQNNVSFTGLIGQPNDRDVWALTTPTGYLHFSLAGASHGPNLDGALELWDSNGSVIAAAGSSSALTAGLGVKVAAGKYYLVARGTGDYGNVGQYSISGKIPSPAPEFEITVDGVPLKNIVVDFGETTEGLPLARTFMVTNAGEAMLTLTPVTVVAGSGFTVLSNVGSSALVPGESTSFTLELDATYAIRREATIRLTNNDEGLFWLQLRGTVNPTNVPDIDISGEFSFEYTTPGTRVTKTFTVTNRGTATLTMSPLEENGWQPFTLVANLGSTLLAPGDSTSFSVAHEGTFLGASYREFDLRSNDPNESWLRLKVSAIVGPPLAPEIDVAIDQASDGNGGRIDFGSTPRGSSRARTIAVTNRGTGPLSLGQLSSRDIPSGFTLLSNFARTTLLPGETTYFSVGLDAAAVGPVTGTIRIANKDSDEATYDLHLAGRVLPPPAPEIELKLDDQSIRDGGGIHVGNRVLGDTLGINITVTNVGSTRLLLTPLDGNKMPSGLSLVSNLDRTWLGPGQSTSFTVKFNAAAAGDIHSTLELLNSDSDESAYEIAFTGTVVTPLRQVVDDGDFGNSLIGKWKRPTGSGYARDTHYTSAGKGTKFSTWEFSNLMSGTYRVFATWTANRKNASNAPFMLFDGDMPMGLVRINQRIAPGLQTAGGRWKLLGIMTIGLSKLGIRLTNAANGFVVADAVRIEQVALPRLNVEIIDPVSSAMPLRSETISAQSGQLAAIVPEATSFHGSMSPHQSIDASIRRSSTVTCRPTEANAQAVRPLGLVNSRALDAAITRLADSETNGLSSIIEGLTVNDEDRYCFG